MGEEMSALAPPASRPALLLLSSSTIHGRGYLDHAERAIRDFLASAGPVLFVPYALHDRDAYADKTCRRFARMGLDLSSLHAASDPREAIASASAFFAGGGNTFRLLRELAGRGLLEPMRERVRSGAFYVGSSAGTNLAGPTIRTTNDMPIVSPVSLDSLGLVPFQLNPHYVDADPASTHMGETREERIRQFHEEPENRAPVLALRESAWLRRDGEALRVGGEGGARLFEAGRPPREVPAAADVSFLLRNP